VEKDIVIALGRGESFVQSSLSGGGLLIDKLATDIVLRSDISDGLLASESLNADGQFFARSERFRGAGVGNGLMQSAGDRNRMTHACFLHEKVAVRTTSLGETGISEKPSLSHPTSFFVTRK
jgi:hypothetical protein